MNDFVQKRTSCLVSNCVIGENINIPNLKCILAIELPTDATYEQCLRYMGGKGVVITLISNNTDAELVERYQRMYGPIVVVDQASDLVGYMQSSKKITSSQFTTTTTTT